MWIIKQHYMGKTTVWGEYKEEQKARDVLVTLMIGASNGSMTYSIHKCGKK